MSYCSDLSDDMPVNKSLLNPPSEEEKMRDMGSNGARMMRFKYVRLRTRVAELCIRLPEESEQSAKRAYQEVEYADPDELDGEHGSGPRKRVRKEKQRIRVAWTPWSGYTPPVNKERFSSGISSSAWCSRMRPATSERMHDIARSLAQTCAMSSSCGDSGWS